jgi:N-acetylgalactosamine kinase
MRSRTRSELGLLFEDTWAARPAVACRAPGRVNIIGEHIDYHGFSVLPMAIGGDIMVVAALKPAEGVGGGGGDRAQWSVEAVNTDADRYPPFSWQVCFPAPGDTIASLRTRQAAGEGAAVLQTEPPWTDYVACGVLGAWEHVVESGRGSGGGAHAPLPPSGRLLLAVGGTVAPASGLSSSSALVCASLLAALAAWGQPVPPAQVLASRAADCERYVGTMGGGMDHAASFLSVPGCALLLHFNPLSTTAVTLPPQATLLVGNSMTRAHKAEEEHPFNVRVIEGKVACILLAVSLGRRVEDSCVTFAELVTLFATSRADSASPLATAGTPASQSAGSEDAGPAFVTMDAHVMYGKVLAYALEILPEGAVSLDQVTPRSMRPHVTPEYLLTNALLSLHTLSGHISMR